MRCAGASIAALLALTVVSDAPTAARSQWRRGLIAQIRIGCALPQPLADCERYADSVRLFDAANGRFSDVASCSCSLATAM